jgi:hypothetical protein
MLNRKFKMSRQNIMYLALLVVAALVLFSWVQSRKVISKYDMPMDTKMPQPIMTPPMMPMGTKGAMGMGAGMGMGGAVGGGA